MKIDMYKRTSGLIRVAASMGTASKGPPGSKEVSLKYAQMVPTTLGWLLCLGLLIELTTCLEEKHKHCYTYFGAIKAIKLHKSPLESIFILIFMSHVSVRVAIPMSNPMTWR
jgi:hypothetical protein